jgi:hypothetical protein
MSGDGSSSLVWCCRSFRLEYCNKRALITLTVESLKMIKTGYIVQAKPVVTVTTTQNFTRGDDGHVSVPITFGPLVMITAKEVLSDIVIFNLENDWH